MSARPRLAIASLALVGIAGCAEEPGVELRWAIHDTASADEVAPLVSVQQCAEVGIERFRFDAYALPRLPSDLPSESRSFPCFPSVFGNPDAFLDGPTLAPGDYEIELIGLRRNGLEWSCGDELAPLPCARTSAELSVSASDPGRLELMVAPPPQCDDGVDNDRDGRVDINDLGCIFDQDYEAFDYGLVVFQLSVRFLDNPLIEPTHAGIASLVLTIDGEPLATFEDTQVGRDQVLGPWDFPPVSARVASADVEGLAIGQHTLELSLLREDGSEYAALTHEFAVGEQEAGIVAHTFEALEPIIAPMHVAWALESEVKGEKGIDGCNSHEIALGTVEVVVKRGDAEIDDIGLRVSGEPALGGNVFACSEAVSGDPFLKANGPPDPMDEDGVTLEWTSEPYTVEINVYSAVPGFEDSRCFKSDPFVARPAPIGAMSVFLEHDLVDGNPKPGCGECTDDDDCLDAPNLECRDRLCVEIPSP